MLLSTTRTHSETNKLKFKMWNETQRNYAKNIRFLSSLELRELNDMLRFAAVSEFKVAGTKKGDVLMPEHQHVGKFCGRSFLRILFASNLKRQLKWNKKWLVKIDGTDCEAKFGSCELIVEAADSDGSICATADLVPTPRHLLAFTLHCPCTHQIDNRNCKHYDISATQYYIYFNKYLCILCRYLLRNEQARYVTLNEQISSSLDLVRHVR